jgi:hypothetical protein
MGCGRACDAVFELGAKPVFLPLGEKIAPGFPGALKGGGGAAYLSGMNL